MIAAFCRQIGPDNLLALLKTKKVKGTYIPHQTATFSETKNGISIHNFCSIEFSGRDNVGKLRRKEALAELLERLLGQINNSKRFANEFLKLVAVRDSLNPSRDDNLIQRFALDDTQDEAFLRVAAERRIQTYLPSFVLPRDWYIRVIRMGENFFIETNFDFSRLNNEIKSKRSGLDVSITPALCVGIVHDVRAEIQLASEYGAELMTSPLFADVIESKFQNLLASRKRSSDQIHAFQSVALESSHAIGDAIRSGRQSFADFMKLLESAEKFRGWLKDVNPDLGLLNEYQKAIVRDTWAEKLPAKTTRFCLFTFSGAAADVTFAGGLGTAAGLALNAADAFLFDKLVKGWRPNQFIEKKLRPFVEK